MAPREIITLQLGHYANHVGTHYWNTQETYLEWPAGELQQADMQMDALYQIGQDTAGHETYTPRVLIVDLKGALQTLKVENELFGGYPSAPPSSDHSRHESSGLHRSSTAAGASSSTSSLSNGGHSSSSAAAAAATSAATWDGGMHAHVAQPHVQNAYLRDLNANTVTPSTETEDDPYHLDGQVNVWSDYNRALYHPRSIYQVDDYAHLDDTLPFYDFEQGKTIAATDAFRDEVIEGRLRSLLENCDYPQGLQVFADVDNGFGGLTSTFLEGFKEDNPKTSVFVYGFASQRRSTDTTKRIRRYRTIGKTTARLLENATTYVPITTSALRHPDALGWSRHLQFDVFFLDFASIK